MALNSKKAAATTHRPTPCALSLSPKAVAPYRRKRPPPKATRRSSVPPLGGHEHATKARTQEANKRPPPHPHTLAARNARNAACGAQRQLSPKCDCGTIARRAHQRATATSPSFPTVLFQGIGGAGRLVPLASMQRLASIARRSPSWRHRLRLIDALAIAISAKLGARVSPEQIVNSRSAKTGFGRGAMAPAKLRQLALPVPPIC